MLDPLLSQNFRRSVIVKIILAHHAACSVLAFVADFGHCGLQANGIADVLKHNIRLSRVSSTGSSVKERWLQMAFKN